MKIDYSKISIPKLENACEKYYKALNEKRKHERRTIIVNSFHTWEDNCKCKCGVNKTDYLAAVGDDDNEFFMETCSLVDTKEKRKDFLITNFPNGLPRKVFQK